MNGSNSSSSSITCSINKCKVKYLDTMNHGLGDSKRRNSTSILPNQYLSPDISSIVTKSPSKKNYSYSYKIDDVEFRKCPSTGTTPKTASPSDSHVSSLSGSFVTEKPKHMTITTLANSKFKLTNHRSIFSSSSKKSNPIESLASSNFCFTNSSINSSMQKRHSISVFKYFSRRYSNVSEYRPQSTLEFAYNQLSTQALALANLPLATVSNKSILELNSLIPEQYNSFQNIDSITSQLEIKIRSNTSSQRKKVKPKNRSKSTPIKIKRKSLQRASSFKKALATWDVNDKNAENHSVISNFASTCSLYNK